MGADPRAWREICRNTPLQFLSTGFRFIAWETASPEFMELAFRTLATNGIRRFALADPNNDAESNVEVAKLVKRAGGEQVVGALVFSISPIHDDAHYAEAARIMAASPDIDALYIKDPGGLLTAKRARTLIPAILAEIGDKPLELHNHCTIGLAEPACLEAADLGVAAVQCASGGAADGTCNPPITRHDRQPASAMGHTVDIDDEAVRRGRRLLHRAGRSRRPADRPARCISMPPICSHQPARRHGRHDAPPPGRPAACPNSKAR